MKITELYQHKKTVISLEVFPPKSDSPIETVYQTVDELSDLRPDFISVTYGAGGSTSNRTIEIASRIKNEYQIESMAHTTCIGSTRAQIKENLKKMKEENIENVLALRGDIPEDPEFQAPGEYAYASELVEDIVHEGGFSVGAACYPEGHIECVSQVKDVHNLKEKTVRGVDFLITQLFFDNELFYEFMGKLELAGVNLPISAGIMPVLNRNQILRMTKLSGCTVPAKLARILDRYADNPQALAEAGAAYAIEQIIDLMAWGVQGIHLYTMNKPQVARRIFENIENVRKLQA